MICKITPRYLTTQRFIYSSPVPATEMLKALKSGRVLNVNFGIYGTGATYATTAPTCIKVDRVGEKKNVGLITFHRPKQMNALCQQLMHELADNLKNFDNDDNIKAIIITGSGKVFAAGADLHEMKDRKWPQVFSSEEIDKWTQISRTSKPVIAAVNGTAFGGGTEITLMCDVAYAAESANFALPEINIGTIPGAGGTQRLIRSVGKSLAMEMCLTGNRISAQQAKDHGLVSRVCKDDSLIPETIKLAEKMGEQSPILIKMCKEAVTTALETPLSEGLKSERRIFFSTFATKDREEGMNAFAEKRKPTWKMIRNE